MDHILIVKLVRIKKVLCTGLRGWGAVVIKRFRDNMGRPDLRLGGDRSHRACTVEGRRSGRVGFREVEVDPVEGFENRSGEGLLCNTLEVEAPFLK